MKNRHKEFKHTLKVDDHLEKIQLACSITLNQTNKSKRENKNYANYTKKEKYN